MIALYFDTHIAKAVAEQMRAKGAKVIRCEEVDMAEAEDFEHLQYATQNQLIMVSQDDDFTRLHASWLQQGKSHSGIILFPKRLQGQGQVSYMVRVLTEYHDMMTEGAATEADFTDQIHYA